MKRYLVVAAVAALALSAAPAAAATIVLSYYGKVSGGTDASGNDLAGESFKAVVTINDALAPSEYSPTFSRIRGGSDYGTTGPVSAVVTIKGVEYKVDGARNSTASQLFLPYTHHMYQESIGNVEGFPEGEGHFRGWVIGYKTPLVDSSDYHDPVATALRRGLTMGGSFGIVNGASNVVYVNYDAKVFAVAGFPFPHVPEPATWAMMIIGFGMTGVAVRRARQSVVYPA